MMIKFSYFRCKRNKLKFKRFTGQEDQFKVDRDHMIHHKEQFRTKIERYRYRQVYFKTVIAKLALYSKKLNNFSDANKKYD